MSYVDNQVRRELIYKIAQISAQSPQPLSSDNSTPKTPSNQDQIKQVVNETQGELSQKVEEFLTSSSVVKWIEETMTPYLEKPVEEFVQKNADKAPEYLSNPETLIADITNEFPIIKYLDYLMKAMDAAFILSSLFSIATIVFSAGATSEIAIPAEVAKWAARKELKVFIRKYARNLLTKITARLAATTITRLGLGAIAGISKHFLIEAALQAGLLITYNLIKSVVTDATLTATKNIIAEKGATEFGLPKEVIEQLINPDTDTDAFHRILDSFTNQTEKGLAQLFTTEQGFKSLAFGAALRKLWNVLGTKSQVSKLNMRADLHHMLQDPSYSNVNRLKQNLLNQTQRAENIRSDNEKASENSLMTKSEVKHILSGSSIPKSLYNDYYEYIEKATSHLQDPEAAKKLATQKVQAADLTVNSIHEAILELGTLDFIKQYKDQLASQPRELEALLQKAAQTNAPIQSLMEETETKDVNSLVDALRKSKQQTIQQLLGRLMIGNKTQSDEAALMDYFTREASLSDYKQNLYEEIFHGESQVPKAKSRA